MFGGDAQNEEIALRNMLAQIGMLLDVQPLESVVYAQVDRDSTGGT